MDGECHYIIFTLRLQRTTTCVQGTGTNYITLDRKKLDVARHFIADRTLRLNLLYHLSTAYTRGIMTCDEQRSNVDVQLDDCVGQLERKGPQDGANEDVVKESRE